MCMEGHLADKFLWEWPKPTPFQAPPFVASSNSQTCHSRKIRHSRKLLLGPPQPRIEGPVPASRAQFRHHSLNFESWTKFQWLSSVAPPLGSIRPLLLSSSIIRDIFGSDTLAEGISVHCPTNTSLSPR